MTEKEYVLLKDVLVHCPKHGSFDVYNIIQMCSQEAAQHYTGTQEIPIRDYLIGEGFANDKGFNAPHGYLIELTEKGRRLKEFGSVEKYNQSLYDENRHRARMERHTYIIQLSIAISTGIAAIYYAIEIFKSLFCQ